MRLYALLMISWILLMGGCQESSTTSDTQKVTEEVSLVKQVPIAKSQEVNTSEDTPVAILLEGEDELNDSLRFRVTTLPLHGELSGVLPNITYTPHPNYNGQDGFGFMVNNGTSDSKEASVKIVIHAVNDQPVAEALHLILPQEGNKTFTLSAYDVDSRTLTYRIDRLPLNGRLLGTPPELTYQPMIGYAGEDHFSFVVSDGELESALKEVNLTIVPKEEVNVSISGQLTYDRVPPNAIHTGLDYAKTYPDTIKAVEVVLLDAQDQVLQVTQSDANGSYCFKNVQTEQLVKVRVYAKIVGRDPSEWWVKVVDNTSENALYALEGELHSSGTTNSLRNLHAPSGWDGTAYRASRQAGPFAILDTIYRSMHHLVAIDENLSFPPLLVNWSVNNVATAGALEDGQIGTSYYSQGCLYILGDANSDTDEYDDHVIAHEWGHYYEDKFSRTDSLGGMHTQGDYLDIRVAFGEGFGNAVSAIFLDDPIYFDTSGIAQSQGWSMDIESNASEHAGWFSEFSVQHILYDLFDANNEGEDNISMGFAPMHRVFIGKQKTTPAFTSLFSFIDALKQENNQSASKIDQVVAQEGIAPIVDAYGSNRATLPEEEPYLKLEVGTQLNLCTTNTYGDLGSRNKLSNHKYVRFTIDDNATGTYQIKVVRNNGTGSDPDFSLYRISNGLDLVGVAESPTQELEQVSTPLSADEYLMDVLDWNTQFNACFDLSVEGV